MLKKTELGKVYYSKFIPTGTFYDVLIVRKDLLLQKAHLMREATYIH